MKTAVKYGLIAIALGFASPLLAADPPAASYAAMVARLNAGAPDVDFTALREAAMAAPGYSGYHMLDRETVENAAQAGDWKKVIALCEAHLKDDFTDINAQTYEALAHRKLGETELADKYRRIWMGLFEAMLKSGDGQSSKTAFRVLGVDEEYFLLRRLRLTLTSQALVSQGGTFDKLDVTGEDGRPHELWFDISGFFGKGLGL